MIFIVPVFWLLITGIAAGGEQWFGLSKTLKIASQFLLFFI